MEDEIEIHIKRHMTSKFTLCSEDGETPLDAVHLHRALTLASLVIPNRDSVLQSNCLVCLTKFQRQLLMHLDASAQRIAQLHRNTLEALDAHLLQLTGDVMEKVGEKAKGVSATAKQIIATLEKETPPFIPKHHKMLALALLSEAQLFKVIDDPTIADEEKALVREELDRRTKKKAGAK